MFNTYEDGNTTQITYVLIFGLLFFVLGKLYTQLKNVRI